MTALVETSPVIGSCHGKKICVVNLVRDERHSIFILRIYHAHPVLIIGPKEVIVRPNQRGHVVCIRAIDVDSRACEWQLSRAGLWKF